MTPLCYVMMEIMRSPSMSGLLWVPKKTRDLLTWSIHFRTSKRSFKAVCSLQWLPKMIFVIHHFGPSNSGHFLLGTPEKCSKDYINIFWEILDIHQVFVGFSASGPQQEPFTSVFWHSNVPVIRGPDQLCTGWKWWIFSVENSSNPARNGFPPAFMRFVFEGNHAVLYRWRIRMSFAQQVGWSNAPVSIYEMQTPWFSHSSGFREHPKASNCQSPLDCTTFRVCSLRRPQAAQSWGSIVAVLLMMLIRSMKDEETKSIRVFFVQNWHEKSEKLFCP